MHDFNYRENTLCCEGIPLTDVIKEHDTPFYLYSMNTVMGHFNRIKEAFRELDPLICFSMKSNSNLTLCRALVSSGSGLDIVSGGELYKALKVGCPPERIVYASVGKTESEIRLAIKNEILLFNVESVPELIMIDSVAKKLKRKVNVAIRVNPDVRPDTHDYITTGAKEKKFGIDFKTAEEIFDNSNKYSHVILKGIHVHIGSQIIDPAPFAEALKKVTEFVDKSGINIEWLNIGGGFGIDYGLKKEAAEADKIAAEIIPVIRDKGFKVILEPGRFIMGNSGILVSKVLYVKTGSGGKKFAIVDAGMNDLLRPSLYKAYHEIVPVVRRDSASAIYDIVGPICESGDYLGLDREMQELIPGEYIAVMGAGAYGYSMASNYNSRPRSAELVVMGSQVKVARRAETYGDLIRGEKIIIP
jgi:diaminopimelate decarboxylase